MTNVPVKQAASYALVSLVVSVFTLGVYHFSGMAVRTVRVESDNEATPVVHLASETGTMAPPEGAPSDFFTAADASMPAVVHIKSLRTVSASMYSSPFYELFGIKPQQQNSRQATSSGSGVILSPEGYIVTNNHVIEQADELDVVLYDNRSYKAQVIGRDPSTDLALIKIEAKNLPYIELANSDQVRVGEWVLAVGNPFRLASTVTAGIVSAIGRDLEIIKDQMAIESFIQTDAAVNPGNSGGALVNLEGKLIGINTAIASPTGAYAGYAFAVPANIVAKIVSDLKTYGSVQRGFMGVRAVKDLNSDIAEQLSVPFSEGVLIEEVTPGYAAEKAGVRSGDIVVSADGIKTRGNSRLQEILGRKRPGDPIELKVYRSGSYKDIRVILTDFEGGTSIHTSQRSEALSELGLELRDLNASELTRLGVEKGVLISRLSPGKIRQQTQIQENFVIMKVNESEVSTAQEVRKMLESGGGKITLTGFYPGYGRLYSYSFDK